MTMCCLKGVASSCEIHRELSSNSAAPLSSAELYGIFQLTVQVSWLATLPFWFTLAAIVMVIFRHSRELFSAEKL